MRRHADKSQAQERAPASTPRFDARITLESISRPRLTGTDGNAQVRELLKSQLNEYGYEVRESGFPFSTWPGRFAVALAGLFFLIGSVWSTSMLRQGHPGVALVLLLTLILLIGAIAVLARPAMAVLPWGRVQGVNLIAHVPDRRPRYFLMAHYDSKSQPVPLAFRGPAIVLAAVAWLAQTVLATAALLDPVWNRGEVTMVLGVVGALSGLILLLCWVDNRSPGALDNASGVATLLGVAQREAANGDVALILTDAEELALAGATAVAGQLPPSFGVINVDGIDDQGGLYLIERFGWRKKQGAAPHLAAALLAAAESMNVPAKRRDVPIGLMLDHIPIVRAGTPALTVMRGNLSSLRRVHRPADNLESLTGLGVELAVDLLSAALENLRAQQKR